MSTVIGIDLGGTAIKGGKFSPDGLCLAEKAVPTPQPSTPTAVAEAIANLVNALNQDHTCKAVGIGIPGPVDGTARIAKVAINLSGWQDVPLADWVEAKTGLPTTLNNDANCAGLGEAWLGAGRDRQNLLLITLGTGVGGAVILNGQLFTGHYGAAGELGLITLNPDGPPCNSGNNGSFEQYCSINGVKRISGKDPGELGELAEAGDAEAIAHWQTYGKLLGAGLTSLIYIFTPEMIILGGGISASSDFFLPAAIAEIERRVLPSSRVDLKLTKAQLGNNAGMVGAAKLALEKISNTLDN
ncbi:ROK family protein [Picosynechococcus sp. PCC 11901]|uniref:ROK family protein n=1 Tax=Picosynechococcus sp. PCC 11901 TaxID=2579791 RepID=UPI0010FBF70F|nr:ROK family protein [Picosynechococcus sp. PCC 11901]QCS48260.1 ROK family protein [Picosynechococcus sp. PCC 11901]